MTADELRKLADEELVAAYSLHRECGYNYCPNLKAVVDDALTRVPALASPFDPENGSRYGLPRLVEHRYAAVRADHLLGLVSHAHRAQADAFRWRANAIEMMQEAQRLRQRIAELEAALDNRHE